MLYIIAYNVLTYQTPQEVLSKFGYKLIEVKFLIIIIFWSPTDHNLTTLDPINFENGETKVAYISRMRSKKL
jgi:hypothetical protein